MYARVATFEGANRDTDSFDAEREQIRSGLQSPPEGLEGVKGVWMLVDRRSGKGLGITLFESEEELRRGDEALNAMSPASPDAGHRTGVDFYEVALREERG